MYTKKNFGVIKILVLCLLGLVVYGQFSYSEFLGANEESLVIEPDMPYPLPESELENWVKISEDVGLMLYADDFGRKRGTLYVRRSGIWKPIALSNATELGPNVIPAGE
jgi:hypothetical protein